MEPSIRTGTDRPAMNTWGFRRIARLDSDLEMFRPFCGLGRDVAGLGHTAGSRLGA
jgi:hypothetical protein